MANNDGETPLLVAAQHGHKAGYHHCQVEALLNI